MSLSHFVNVTERDTSNGMEFCLGGYLECCKYNCLFYYWTNGLACIGISSVLVVFGLFGRYCCHWRSYLLLSRFGQCR